MNSSFRSRSAAARVERAASLWAIRCERGLTAAEQDEFLQWLAADQQHGREYARQRGNWARLASLADWRPEHSPRPNRDLLAPPPRLNLGWRNVRPLYVAPIILAAAAAVVIGLFLRRAEPIAPAAARAETIASIERRPLPDGSTVTLNRGAAIAVRYTAGERRIQLDQGEAHFEVAPAANRPFIVSVGGIDVRAVGTAFNVRLHAASVDVLVTHGAIKLARTPSAVPAPHDAGGPPNVELATIAAGQRGVISVGDDASPPDVAVVSAEQMDEILAWKPRFVTFTDTPLLAIVAEFNRRNAPVYITIGDASLAQTEVTASLRSDNVEGFIRLLEVGFGVEATRAGNLVNLRRATKPERSRSAGQR